MDPASLGRAPAAVVLHARVAGSLLALPLLLRVASVRKLVALLTPGRLGRPRPWAEVERVCRATDRLNRRRLLRSYGPCLRRSLTLYYFLTRLGYPVKLALGAQVRGGVLAAHAWLTLDGRPFLEPGRGTATPSGPNEAARPGSPRIGRTKPAAPEALASQRAAGAQLRAAGWSGRSGGLGRAGGAGRQLGGLDRPPELVDLMRVDLEHRGEAAHHARARQDAPGLGQVDRAGRDAGFTRQVSDAQYPLRPQLSQRCYAPFLDDWPSVKLVLTRRPALSRFEGVAWLFFGQGPVAIPYIPLDRPPRRPAAPPLTPEPTAAQYHLNTLPVRYCA